MDLLATIRIFRRVAELASFSAAAKDLKTSQPSVSRAVAALEQELGVPLFRRSTRHLRLTNEGQRLLLGSQDVLSRVEDMIASVRDAQGSLDGTLRVAVSPSVGRHILTPMVERFARRHPRLSIQFRLDDRYVNLIEDNIDVAVRMGILPDSSLRARRIGTSRLKLYASKKYLKAHGKPRTLAELHRHKLLFFPRRSTQPVWDLHDGDGQAVRFAFKPYFESDGVDMVREAVVRGLGISILPSWMMIEAEAARTVERVLEVHTREEVPLHALTTGPEDSQRQRAWIDFLREEFDAVAALSPRAPG